MNDEYGLFIIWSKARYNEKKILDDINIKFELINIFNIVWSEDEFSNNLSRFYGEKLPNNSFKEKECGKGEFLLVIVKDNNPIYLNRKTSKGIDKVNINFFDSKELYRNWTGGGHKIHSSNNIVEFKHDLMMLIGLNLNDYLKKYKKSSKYIFFKENIIGMNGWQSLEEIFYVLNETISYVVLRNFDNLPVEYKIGEHGDIDLLCDNYFNICSILNSKPVSKQSSRVRNKVKINNEYVYFDFRYIGDDYYDKNWELNILLTRNKYNGFYIPNMENYAYSLLYHALIQKKKISSDYYEKFKILFGSNNRYNDNLIEFLEKNDYKIVYPKDISVYFNEKNSKKKDKYIRKLYLKFYPILSKINLE